MLITGGSGFIGSNFVHLILEKHSEYSVINLDALTYAGNNDNHHAITDNPNYTFIHGNICDRELVQKLFAQYDFSCVVHFAAESHVDRSITGPETVHNNKCTRNTGSAADCKRITGMETMSTNGLCMCQPMKCMDHLVRQGIFLKKHL